MMFELLVEGDANDGACSEVGLCVMFSRLDRFFAESIGKSWGSPAMYEQLKQDLLAEAGPHRSILVAEDAIECGSSKRFHARVSAALLGPGAINRALLRTRLLGVCRNRVDAS